MPTQGEILGFSNRWYPLALDIAQPQGLPSGRSIRIVTAPVFLATKLEAFRGRGQGSFLFSHDLEEPDGGGRRPRLAAGGMQAQPAFLEALPAFPPPDQASQQRLPDLLEITALAEPRSAARRSRWSDPAPG